MATFAQLWEQIEKNKARSPLMTSGEEERALTVVRAGLDLHDENDTSFWDELISLCSNTDGLSQLLGVSREKVASWPAKIRDSLDKVERHNRENPSEKQKTEIIPTGDNGAITTNADPTNIGDLT